MPTRLDMLAAEIAFRETIGAKRVTIAEMDRQFRALGYRLDRDRDCYSLARYIDSGRAYPSISTGAKEIDSGLQYCNADARRDENFRAFQKLRGEIFAVTRGAILEV